jgi:hypothetical protein
VKGVCRELRLGTELALLLGAGCFLLARCAFGHLYYLSVLLPAALVSMLLVAWFIHLKSDGFFHGAVQARSNQTPEHGETGPSPFCIPFEEGVLKRSSPAGESPWPWPACAVGRALLWGAAELGLASIALYFGAGIGARLFR